MRSFMVVSCLLLLVRTPSAQAVVLFQDDTFYEVPSDSILIGSNDGGAINTSIRFGTDVTSSENGNITWDISTNTFDFDHSIDVTGGATVSGTTTLNGAATIGDGGDDISINSNDWDISSAGVASGLTGITSSGTVSTTGSLEVSGSANIGDGGDDVFINSNDWDISSDGVASGFTGMTSTGAVNYTGATYQGPQGAADPGTCTIGQYFYNTSSGLLKICTSTNTWSPLLRSDTSQNFTSGTLTFNSGTTLTGNGVINFTAATSFRPPQGSSDPVSCSVGQQFYNTTSNAMKVCTSTNIWTIAVSGAGADLLDGVDGSQFLRSDVSDNYTSGTLTLDNGTTLAIAGVANIGDGGDDVFINSNDWDVSSTGVASGFTGLTTTGTVNLSGTSSLRIREGADEATAACTTVKEIFLDTTENRAYVCTVTGSPGTWVGLGGGDSQTVDGVDSGSFLRSDASDTYSSGTLSFDDVTTLDVNGIALIGDNGDDVVINSDSWDIDGAGVASGFTGLTTSGALTSTGSFSVTGTAAIGDGGDDININSNDWDISSAGVGSGFTGFSSSGTVNFTSGMSSSGGTINFNDSSANATNINTGTSTGAVTIGNTAAGAVSVLSGTNISLQPGGTGTGNVQVGTGAGTATPDLVVLDIKNTAGDPAGTAGAIYYNSNLGKFRCFEAAWFDCIRNPVVSSVVDASITSPTPGTAPTYGTEIELLNPTRPSITPDNTSQRVLITGAVQFTNPTGGDDTNASIRVRIRRGSGNCSGTQVGADITTGFSDPSQSYLLPFFLIDSPATASPQSYTVCASTLDTNGAGGTNATTPNVSIILQQVAP